MIQFDVKWFDLNRNLLTGDRPVAVLPRGQTDRFWVPAGDVFADGAELSLTEIGDYVSIPVTAYRTAHRAVSAVFGLGVQIGLAAVAAMRKHTDDTPKRVVLVLGHECTDLTPDDAFRCYVGIAIQTR